MTTTYENSVQDLNNMLTEEAVDQRVSELSEDERKVLDILQDILESKTLYIENEESSSALILADGINSKVFEAVAQTSVSVMEDILDEEDEEAAEDEADAEDDESEAAEESTEAEDESINEDDEEAEEADDADEAEADEESEVETAEESFEDEEDKIACQESILSILESDKLVIKADLEKQGLVINENSPYFGYIKESLLERLIDTCETEEEFAVCEEIIAEYEGDVLESAGYSVKNELTEEDEGEEEDGKEEVTEAGGIRAIYARGKKLRKKAKAPAKAAKDVAKAPKKYAPTRVAKKAGVKAMKAAKKLKLIAKQPTKAAKKIAKSQVAALKSGDKVATGQLVKQAKKAGVKLQKYGLTKRGKVAVGAAGAGLAVGGAALLRKKLKKKKLNKEEVENSGRTPLELVEKGAFFKGTGKAVSKLWKGGQKAKAAQLVGRKITRGVVKNPGKTAIGVGLGAAYLGKRKREKAKTAAYQKGMQMAGESTEVKEGKLKNVGTAAKVVAGLGVGALAGKGLAGRAGRKKRKAMADSPAAYSPSLVKGYKKALKGKAKVAKGQAKLQTKLAKIKAKYN